MNPLVRVAPVLFALAMVTGCAQYRLGEPVPSIDNIRMARAAHIAPVALGEFRLAPGKDSSLDRSVSVRTNRVFSPYDGSFAKYLKQTLVADLGAAGLLDPASPVVLGADLTDTSLDVPTGTATGRVAARFTVTRAGRKVYERELVAQASWAASFLGVAAVSAGIDQYTQLYRDLVTQLLNDPAFITSVGTRR